MSDEDFDLEGFMSSLIIPTREVAFLRVESVSDPECTSCFVFYEMRTTSGATEEVRIGVEWDQHKRVLRFSKDISLDFIDQSDEEEMNSLANLVYEFNILPWGIGTIVCSKDEMDGSLEATLFYSMTIPPFDRHFADPERLSVARIFVGYNLCTFFGSVVAATTRIFDDLRKVPKAHVEMPHMLQ